MVKFSKAIKYVFLGTTGLLSVLIAEYVLAIISVVSESLAEALLVYVLSASLIIYVIGFILAVYGYILLYTAIHDYNKEVRNIGSPWYAILGLIIPPIGYILLYNVFSELNEKLKTPAKLLPISIFMIVLSLVIALISMPFMNTGQSSLTVLIFIFDMVILIAGLLSIVVAWAWLYKRTKQLGL
jgi:hypothetical protein